MRRERSLNFRNLPDWRDRAAEQRSCLASGPVRQEILRANPHHPAQHGAVLAVALIFLVLLSLLGFSVMSVSRQELRMAGQFMTQSQTQERAEACLGTAQAEAVILADTLLNVSPGVFTAAPGHIDTAGGAEQPAIDDADWWGSPGNTLPCGSDGRYVIEYLGIQNMVTAEDRYTGATQPVHAFRITARSGSTDTASVMLQGIYLRNAL